MTKSRAPRISAKCLRANEPSRPSKPGTAWLRKVHHPGADRRTTCCCHKFQEADAKRRSDVSNRILVFYGSYRSDRMGIRLAQFVVDRLRRGGDDVELIDAKAINLPMLD